MRWCSVSNVSVIVASALGPAMMTTTCDARSLSAVVTGSNKGIGFEICRQLLQAGVSVIVATRNVQLGEEAARLLQKGHNGHLVLGFVQMDVSDDASVSRSAKRIASLAGGKLDILVNNAGIAYTDNTFGAEEAWATVNTNTIGTMRASRALLPLLSASHSGRIVNIASVEGGLAQVTRPLQERFSDVSLTDAKLVALMQEFVAAAAEAGHKRKGWKGTMYAASKLGQLAFAGILAREFASSGSNMTVTSCCPGFCRTDMSAQCYGPGLGHKSAAEGADTPVWLALMQSEDAKQSHGHFYTDRTLVRIF